jgi:hypothetical protein
MQQINKPVTLKINERADELFYFMSYQSQPLTKQELCKAFGWIYNKNNERRIRDVISTLAQKEPIVSTSDSRGYYLAKNEIDGEAVIHQERELQSRIDELKKRLKPLQKFLIKNKINSLNK